MKVAYDYTIDGGINSFEKFLCGKVKRECPYLRGEGRFFFAFFVSFSNNRMTYYKEVKKKERIQKIENKGINLYEDGYLLSEKKLDIWGVFESKNSKIIDLVRESSNSGRNFIFYAKKKKFII